MVSVGFIEEPSRIAVGTVRYTVSPSVGVGANRMRDIFQKCRDYEDAKQVINAGVYPYFRPIESTIGSSVVTHGKRRVMIGSNNYLGLTHHPRVQAAAKAAI